MRRVNRTEQDFSMMLRLTLSPLLHTLAM